MVETLVQIIRTIEQMPKYVIADEKEKDRLMGNAFEEWGRKNPIRSPIVRDVMGGKTTFHKEYQKAFSLYNSWRLYVPYPFPEDFKESVADLEACIGDSGSYGTMFQLLIGNPIGCFFVGAILPAFLTLRNAKRSGKLSRRELLSTILSGGIGAFIGYLGASNKSEQLNYIEQNAIFLDTTYTRIFKPLKETGSYKYYRRGFFATLIGQPYHA